MQLRSSHQVILARRGRLMAAAAVAAASVLSAPHAFADGTFTSTQGGNATWETGTIWAKLGDNGGQVFPGDGVAPLADVFRTLRDIGYRGMLSLELFNPEYYKRDAFEVVKEGLTKTKAAVKAALA